MEGALPPIPEDTEPTLEIVEETQYEVLDDITAVQQPSVQQPSEKQPSEQLGDQSPGQSRLQHDHEASIDSSLRGNFRTIAAPRSQYEHNELLGLKVVRPKSSGAAVQDQYDFTANPVSEQPIWQSRPTMKQVSGVNFSSSVAIQLPKRGQGRDLSALPEIEFLGIQQPHTSALNNINDNLVTSGESHSTLEQDAEIPIKSAKGAGDDVPINVDNKAFKGEVSGASAQTDSLACKYRPQTRLQPPKSLNQGHEIQVTANTAFPAKDNENVYPLEQPCVQRTVHRDKQAAHGEQIFEERATESSASNLLRAQKGCQTLRTHQALERQAEQSQGPQQFGNHMPIALKRPRATRRPTLPEIMKVLGNTLQAEVQKNTVLNEATREAHRAELLDLKGTISRLASELKSADQKIHELTSTNKSNLDKLNLYAEKATTLQKFLNGLNNDMQRERTAAKERDSQITALKSDSNSLQHHHRREKEKFTLAIERIGEVKTKVSYEFRELQNSYNKLETEKKLLLEDLKGKEQILLELRDEQNYLRRQIALHEQDQRNLRNLIESSRDVISGEFSELHTALKGLGSASKKIFDVANAVCEFRKENPGELGVMKVVENVVEALDTRINGQLKEFTDSLRIDRTEEASAILINNVHEDIRERFRQLGADIMQLQSLQEQVGGLQEEKLAFIERLNAQDSQIAALIAEMKKTKLQERMFSERNALLEDRLKTQVSSHSPTMESAVEELVEEKRQKLAAGKREEALRAELSDLRLTITSKEDEILSLVCNMEKLKAEGVKQLKKLRIDLANDADRVHKDQKAEYENKLGEVQKKYKQVEQELQELQATSSAQPGEQTNRRQTWSAKSNPAITQMEYEATISTLRLEHERAMADQIRRADEELKLKVSQAHKDLDKIYSREKQELEIKASGAETEREAVSLDLQEARAVCESLSKQLENTRRHLQRRNKSLQEEEDVETNLPSGSRNNMEAPHQRADKVEARLEKVHQPPSVNEVQPSPITIMVPTFTTPKTRKKVSRVINRGESAPSQTPRSTIFDAKSHEKVRHSRPREDAPHLIQHSNIARQPLTDLDVKHQNKGVQTSAEDDMFKMTSRASSLSWMASSDVESLLPSHPNLNQDFKTQNKTPRANFSQLRTSMSGCQPPPGEDIGQHSTKTSNTPEGQQTPGSIPRIQSLAVTPSQNEEQQALLAYGDRGLLLKTNVTPVLPHRLSDSLADDPSSAPAWLVKRTQASHRRTTYGQLLPTQKPPGSSKALGIAPIRNDRPEVTPSRKRQRRTGPNEFGTTKRRRGGTAQPTVITKHTLRQSDVGPFQQHNEIHRPALRAGETASVGVVVGTESLPSPLSSARYQNLPTLSKLQESNGPSCFTARQTRASTKKLQAKLDTMDLSS